MGSQDAGEVTRPRSHREAVAELGDNVLCAKNLRFLFCAGVFSSTARLQGSRRRRGTVVGRSLSSLLGLVFFLLFSF